MIKKLVAVLFCCRSLFAACPKDYVEWQGSCVSVQAPVEVIKGDNPAWVSDEKPSRHPEPAWQRGEVNALMLPPAKESTDTAHNYLAETNQK